MGTVSTTHDIVWIVLAALLVVRIAIGVARKDRRRSAGTPPPAANPTAAPSALNAIRPVAAPTSTDRSVLLEVRGLTVAYGPKVAVDEVNFDIQAFGRLLYIGLVVLGLFGASGELGGFWDTVSKWTPVGALMQVFAGVVGTFDTQDWLSLLACGGYVVVLTTLGIYWFRFDVQWPL